MKKLIETLRMAPNSMLVMVMTLFLAIGIGIYMSMIAQVAASAGWSYSTLALIYSSGGSGTLLGMLTVGVLTRYTITRAFLTVFSGLMIALLVVIAITPYDPIAWGVFSFFKGLLHAYFYHTCRVLLIYRARQSSYSSLFAAKYFILCLGSIASPLAISCLSLQTALVLYAACYGCIAMAASQPIKIPQKSKIGHNTFLIFHLKLLPIWLLAVSLGAVAEVSYDFIIPHLRSLGFDSMVANSGYSMLLAGAIALQLPVSHMIEKRNTTFRTAIVALATGIMFLALPLMPHFVLTAMAALVVIGGSSAAMSVLADTYVCKVLPTKQHSSGLQASELSYFCGSLIGSQVIGLAMDTMGAVWGYAIPMATFALFAICMLMLVTLSQKRQFGQAACA